MLGVMKLRNLLIGGLIGLSEVKNSTVFPRYGKEFTVLTVRIKRFRSTKKFSDENPDCINVGYKITIDDNVCTTSTCRRTYKEALEVAKEEMR